MKFTLAIAMLMSQAAAVKHRHMSHTAVPTPDGPWVAGVECDGEKFATFRDVTTFADGEAACRAEAAQMEAATFCCRCDRGDGVNTDKCWL